MLVRKLIHSKGEKEKKKLPASWINALELSIDLYKSMPFSSGRKSGFVSINSRLVSIDTPTQPDPVLGGCVKRICDQKQKVFKFPRYFSKTLTSLLRELLSGGLIPCIHSF